MDLLERCRVENDPEIGSRVHELGVANAVLEDVAPELGLAQLLKNLGAVLPAHVLDMGGDCRLDLLLPGQRLEAGFLLHFV